MQNINTAYDDVFHTLMHDCPCLIIPVVNEIFDEDYTGQETIELSQNELYFQQADGTEAERITDSSFVIEKPGGWKKRYHLECQSTPDGSMVIRMFEYDSLIAIHNGEQTKEGLVVRYPKSAIVYLRYTKNTPDKLIIRIETPDGRSISYTVPILKVKEYSIEEIFQKNLLFLIPFYIFSYEKELKAIVGDEEKLAALKEEYRAIRIQLDELCQKGVVNEYTKQTIIAMTEMVVNSLARKYEVIARGVADSMGGKILEYEAKDILKRGKDEGIQLGRKEGLKDGHTAGVNEKTRTIVTNMLKRNMPDADICALAECSQELVDEIKNNLK